MFEKTNEIINNSTPESFLYALWIIKKDRSGFYRRDDNSFEPFTSSKFFDTAKDAAEVLFDVKMCDALYPKMKRGFTCVRFALYKMNNEILDEIKNNILENENIYAQDWYDDHLNWEKENNFFPNDLFFSEKAFPYTHPTENFVKSWTYEDLLKYCEYNDVLREGQFDLCKFVEYEKFIFVYDCETGDFYFGISDYDRLEDYRPTESEEDQVV